MNYNVSMSDRPEFDPELARAEARNRLRENYDTSYWPLMRWEVDKLASNPVNIHQRAIGALGLAGYETVLDIGCSDGRQLAAIRESGHQGRLIGIDNNELAITSGELMYKEELDPGSLMVADAEDIELDDNSVDATMALFVLYHVDDLDRALSEIRRVTRPGGKVVVTTSGRGNKFRIHQLEEAIVSHLDGRFGEPLTKSFTNREARQKLPEFFGYVEELPHVSPIYLRDPRLDAEHSLRLEIYKTGLSSYHALHTYQPAGASEPIPISLSDWELAFNEVARPMIDKKIRDIGAWVDLIDRSIFVCTNDK